MGKPSGWHGRGSRHARGYGTAWEKARAKALERDGWQCVRCKAEGRHRTATNVDHRVPKAKGGTDDLSNLDSLCDDHRAIKDREDNGGTFIRKPQIGPDGYPIDD